MVTVYKCIDDFVDKAELRIPIYTNDIFEYVKKRIPDLSKATFNMTLQRYEKARKDFVRFQKGIYYKTKETPFGFAGIDKTALITRKYINDGGEIYGYETGPSYINKLGLTTQMSNMIYIATINTRYNVEDKENKIFLIKPVIEINKDNYRYLQFLDIIDNKMNVKFETKDYKKILRKYIKTYNLTFEKLIGYAKYYNSNNVYIGLSNLAQGVK